MGTSHQFHIGDYAVFLLTIIISIGIGIYYALSGGRQRTTSEYLVGGRSMGFIPVAISLMVSFESSIMMLGLPAEAYIYGIQYIILSLGFMLSQLLSIYIVVPLLHPLKITSAYEYLELRFRSRSVRLIGTLMGMMSYTWYMGIVLFGPAIALEAVTGFPLWASISSIAVVAVIYTSIGGLKAVIWTDVFQAFVMFCGIFAILIKGSIEAGGAKAVWDTANDGGRLNFFVFDMDPRTRHTFFTCLVSSLFRGFGLAFNQSTVQRISSIKSEREAKMVLFMVAPAFFLSLALALYEGIVAYAYYFALKCDPFESNQISNPNQIIPFVVMDIFKYLPGMPGLFLASLFSASLSTLSSGLSSLSALLWADIVHPILGPNVTELKATLIAKVSVVLFGILASFIALLVSLIGGPLTQIAGTLLSAFAGPLTGIFFLACFFPRVKSTGAVFGGIVGFAASAWIALGMNFSSAVRKTPWLPPAPVDNCPAEFVNATTDLWGEWNMTTTTAAINSTMMTTTAAPVYEAEGVDMIYTMSYLWISPIGTLFTITAGVICSVFTGMNKPGDVDPRYLINFSTAVFFCFPKSWTSYIASIGTQFNKEEFKEKFPDPAKIKDMTALDTDMEVKDLVNVTCYDQVDNGNVQTKDVKDASSRDLNGANGKNPNHHEQQEDQKLYPGLEISEKTADDGIILSAVSNPHQNGQGDGSNGGAMNQIVESKVDKIDGFESKG